MRLAGRERLGFYPLPLREAKRIRNFLRIPGEGCSALDPCIGEGFALAEIVAHTNCLRYGVEIDSGRVTSARSVAEEVIHGNCFDVQCPVESLSLIYLNPPYDFEIAVGEGRSQRTEKLFLEHVYRWLKRAGLLIMVIPSTYVADCSQLLASQFKDVQIYRLTEPESVKYKQVVIFGIRRTRAERERLRDNEIVRARSWYEAVPRETAKLAALPDETDQHYAVPKSEPVRLVYKGLPLDQIEDLLPKSSAYRQAAPILFAPPADIHGRPLTPLHGGHVGLLCTAGMLNGIFGEADSRHIVYWQSVKLVDTAEEEEDGATVIREKERFSNELTLVFGTGEIVSLK